MGEALLSAFDVLTMDHYVKYLDGHYDALAGLQAAAEDDPSFAQLLADFESQKVCYLPLNALLLKPLHRVLHYELLLESESPSGLIKFTDEFRYLLL